jgi:preprotein translocase subunit SecE
LIRAKAYENEAVTVRAMVKESPLKFLREVRAEIQKVTWPSRRETGVTTAMVFVMAALAGVFFLLADTFIRVAVTMILGIGS